MPLIDTVVRNAKNFVTNCSLRDMEGLHLFVSSKGHSGNALYRARL